jgi:putative transposase
MYNNFDWRTNRQCVVKLFFQVIFVTKYRLSVFNEMILLRLEEIFIQIMHQFDGNLIEFGAEEDHVHLLISITPKHSLAKIVSILKGRAAFNIRKDFWNIIKEKLWGKHLWSSSYCVVSCGGAPLSVLKKYILSQKLH